MGKEDLLINKRHILTIIFSRLLLRPVSNNVDTYTRVGVVTWPLEEKIQYRESDGSLRVIVKSGWKPDEPLITAGLTLTERTIVVV